MRQIPPPVFSRRSFIFFILLAPACLLAVVAIVVTLQYKQFQAMVSPAPVVEESGPTTESRQRLDNLQSSLSSFSNRRGPDTLRLSAHDLTVLTAASPVLQRERIRFRFTVADSLLVAESSQRVEAMSGRFAWIFKRIAPAGDGWLNARMEGLPEWKAGALGFAPERSFLNGAKVPRAAMSKRGGMSPKDFLDPSAEPQYNAFITAIDTVLWDGRNVELVRKPELGVKN
jgi:hypothetical protein